ncbi:MAG: DUF4255 domain-containing protein, partial [Schlesneria sp.]
VSTWPLDRANADRASSSKRLNLYLFLTTPNAAFRNMDVNPNGQPRREDAPALALQLHYLLTPFVEDDAKEEADHRLLGVAKQVLQDNSVLSPEYIRESTAGNNPDEFDLHRQKERVRILWQPMQPDEMSKLWTLFSQTPYRHSEVYVVTPILIDSSRRSKVVAPVLSRGTVQPDGRDFGVYVGTELAPVITRIYYGDMRTNLPAFVSAVSGDVISIAGQRIDRAVSVVIYTEVYSEDGTTTLREIETFHPEKSDYRPDKADNRLLFVQLNPNANWISGRLLLAVTFISARGDLSSCKMVPIDIAPEIVVSAGGASALTLTENGRNILIVTLKHPLRPKAEPILNLVSLDNQQPPGPIRSDPSSSHASPLSLVFNLPNRTHGKYRLSISVDGIESRFVKRNGLGFEFDPQLEIEL